MLKLQLTILVRWLSFLFFWLFKRLEANAIVFPASPWNFSSVAPRPPCEASVFDLVLFLFDVKMTVLGKIYNFPFFLMQ